MVLVEAVNVTSDLQELRLRWQEARRGDKAGLVNFSRSCKGFLECPRYQQRLWLLCPREGETIIIGKTLNSFPLLFRCELTEAWREEVTWSRSVVANYLRPHMDCSPPGSSVHGPFQARILEWVAIFFSRGSSQPRNWSRASRLAGRCFTSEPPGKPQ